MLRWSYLDIDSKTSEMKVEEGRWYVCQFNDDAVVQTTYLGSQLDELSEPRL